MGGTTPEEWRARAPVGSWRWHRHFHQRAPLFLLRSLQPRLTVSHRIGPRQDCGPRGPVVPEMRSWVLHCYTERILDKARYHQIGGTSVGWFSGSPPCEPMGGSQGTQWRRSNQWSTVMILRLTPRRTCTGLGKSLGDGTAPGPVHPTGRLTGSRFIWHPLTVGMDQSPCQLSVSFMGSINYSTPFMYAGNPCQPRPQLSRARTYKMQLDLVQSAKMRRKIWSWHEAVSSKAFTWGN